MILIGSTAQHGCARKALNLMKDSGTVPNDIAFQFAMEGLSRKDSEPEERTWIMPNEKQCVCIVDLLGRAGRLSDAESFIMELGFSDAPVMWRALLSACRVHKNAAERVIEMEPEAAASYVLLYNFYHDAGMRTPAKRVRELMKERGIKKEPGVSWTEVGNRVHSFLVGDRSHPKSKIIIARFEEMLEKIKKIGYTNERFVSDAFEQEGRNSLAAHHHSEQLAAVTLGIISLPPSATRESAKIAIQ